MLYTIKKSFMLSLIVLLSINSIFANSHINEDDSFYHQADKYGSWSGTDDCNSKLKIGELRATKIKAHCEEVNKLTALKIQSDTICANDLDVGEARFNEIDTQALCTNVVSTTSLNSNSVCANHLSVSQDACFSSLDAQEVCTHALSASSINSNTLCVRNLNVAEQLCVESLDLESACIGDLQVEDGCINTLAVNNLLNCGVYRATMTYSTNTTYTLGTIVDWDLILDDPNGDIVLVPNSAYVAPLSGYYTLFYQFDQFNLQGEELIIGTPIVNLEIQVNGVPARQTYFPYLSFHNEQRATTSGLISLKAGDVVTCRYTVLLMRDGVGFVEYDGTVEAISNGNDQLSSLFKIHLLSVDCDEVPQCPECSRIDCVQPCEEVCEPCAPVQCVPDLCTPVRPTPCECMPCPKPCCTACPTDTCPLIRE